MTDLLLLQPLFEKARDAQLAHDLDTAETAYREYLQHDPANFKALNNLAMIERERGRAQETLDLLKRALAANPESPEVHNNMGLVLAGAEQHHQAIECFSRCLALVPNAPLVLYNKAASLNIIGHYGQARLLLLEAIRGQAINPEAYNSLAMALWGLGEDEQAIEHCGTALAYNPYSTLVRENLGAMLLAVGRYAEGWTHQEHRTFQVSYDRGLPRWNGSPLGGDRRVLIWGEQGLGDYVLQLSLLPDLRAVPYLWQTDGRLLALIRRALPGANVVVRPNEAQAATLTHQIPALSLGQYFRRTAADFPKPYRLPVLRADPVRVAEMRNALAIELGEKLIGISWASPASKYGQQKSTELAEWADVLGVSRCRFVDLQYGNTTAEREAFSQDTGLWLEHVQGLDLTNDLDGAAALMTACDLVITVSNATAHISCALGVPTWVLVPRGIYAFWHWGRSGDATPWYSSARVIRKEEPLSWGSTLRRVALDLLTFSQHAVDIAAAEPQPIGPNVRSSS